MKPRSTISLGVALVFSQLVNSATSSSNAINARETQTQCTFAGNGDFYGIGVRLGFYLMWISGLIAFVLNPGDSDGQADANTIFLLANLIALIIFQVQKASETNVVVPILLFYMFFGGVVSAVTSATTSLEGWKKANRTRKVALISRQILVQLTFIGTLVYSLYFWTSGYKKFQLFPPECGGTYVFPVAHRVSLDTPSAGSVLALLLLVIFYLLIWFVSYKRLRRSFETHAPLNGSKLTIHHGDEDTLQPPWEKRQLHWTIFGGVLITAVIIWSIAGIELTLTQNRVTDVNSLGSTSQLIPFIIGVASLPTAIWGAVENWEEVKEKHKKVSDYPEDIKAEKPETQDLLPSAPLSPSPSTKHSPKSNSESPRNSQ